MIYLSGCRSSQSIPVHRRTCSILPFYCRLVIRSTRFAVVALLLGILSNQCLARAEVRICNLQDINLGTWSGTGDLQGNDDVHVFDETNTTYKIRASGGAGGYELTGSGSPVPYHVFWKDSSGTSGGYTELDHATDSSTFDNAEPTENCTSVNANVKIVVEESDLGAAAAGNYSATLTLLLLAE